MTSPSPYRRPTHQRGTPTTSTAYSSTGYRSPSPDIMAKRPKKPASPAEEWREVARQCHDRGIDECYIHEDHTEAVTNLRRAIMIRESVVDKYHNDTAISYFRLACVLREYADTIHRRRSEEDDQQQQQQRKPFDRLQSKTVLKAALVAARREMRISSHIFFVGYVAARSSESSSSNDEEDTIFSMMSSRAPSPNRYGDAKGNRNNDYGLDDINDDDENDDYFNDRDGVDEDNDNDDGDEVDGRHLVPRRQDKGDEPLDAELMQRFHKREVDDDWLIGRIQWMHRVLEDLEVVDPMLLTHYKKHLRIQRFGTAHEREQDWYCEKLLQSIEYERLGDKHFSYNEAALALSQYNCALTIETTAYARNVLDQADLHYKMGECLTLLQDYESAIEEYGKVVDMYQFEYSIHREGNPYDEYKEDVTALAFRGKEQRHSPTKGWPPPQIRQAHASKCWPPILVHHGVVAKCLSKMGSLHLKLEQFDSALETFSKSCTLWQTLVGTDHEHYKESLQDIRLVTVKEMEYLRRREAQRKKKLRKSHGQVKATPNRPSMASPPTKSVMIRSPPSRRETSLSSRSRESTFDSAMDFSLGSKTGNQAAASPARTKQSPSSAIPSPSTQRRPNNRSQHSYRSPPPPQPQYSRSTPQQQERNSSYEPLQFPKSMTRPPPPKIPPEKESIRFGSKLTHVLKSDSSSDGYLKWMESRNPPDTGRGMASRREGSRLPRVAMLGQRKGSAYAAPKTIHSTGGQRSIISSSSASSSRW